MLSVVNAFIFGKFSFRCKSAEFLGRPAIVKAVAKTANPQQQPEEISCV
jgi:hypothetical protein